MVIAMFTAMVIVVLVTGENGTRRLRRVQVGMGVGMGVRMRMEKRRP